MIYTICGIASLPTSTTTLVKYATNAEEETGNEAVTVSTQMSVLKLSSSAADTHCRRLGHCLTMHHQSGRYACCSHSVCSQCCKYK